MANNPVVVLQSNFSGRSFDLCDSLSDAVIKIEKGVDAIVGVVHRRDLLFVVLYLFVELMKLLDIKYSTNKSFTDFEARSNALLSRFNAFSTNTKLSGALYALILLANAPVNAGQCILILSAAASLARASDPNNFTEHLVILVYYESAATIFRQYDHAPYNDGQCSSNQANAATLSPFFDHRSTENPCTASSYDA